MGSESTHESSRGVKIRVLTTVDSVKYAYIGKIVTGLYRESLH
jgi:hypothetical protein